jgi:hypothetical protein
MLAPNRNPSARELRQFTLIWFPAFFAVLGGLTWYRSGSPTPAIVLWTVGLVLSVAGLVRPPFMRLVYAALITVTYPIGWTISHLVLAVIFFLVVTPMGLVRRWLGRSAVQLHFDRAAATYWVAHDPGVDTARYFRQF